MNTLNATVENVTPGTEFKMGNQAWVIVRFSDYSDNQKVKETLAQNGIYGTLVMRKPNGKKLYAAPMCKNNVIWDMDIKNA